MFGEYLHITFKEDQPGGNISGLTKIKPSVEDCFMALMNKK
jgi:hypothetical protein